jgi:hypothetical protein
MKGVILSDDMLNGNPIVGKETDKSLETALVLSKICVPLMFIESIIGLFVPGTYAKGFSYTKDGIVLAQGSESEKEN